MMDDEQRRRRSSFLPDGGDVYGSGRGPGRWDNAPQQQQGGGSHQQQQQQGGRGGYSQPSWRQQQQPMREPLPRKLTAEQLFERLQPDNGEGEWRGDGWAGFGGQALTMGRAD